MTPPLSVLHNVGDMLLVSTDKACKPLTSPTEEDGYEEVGMYCCRVGRCRLRCDVGLTEEPELPE